MSKTWVDSSGTDNMQYEQYFWMFPRSLLRGVALAVQVVVTSSYDYQRVFLRFVQPVVFSGILIVFSSIIHSPSVMIALGALVLLVMSVYMGRRLYLARKAHSRHLTVIAPDLTYSTPVPTFVEFDEADESAEEDSISEGSVGERCASDDSSTEDSLLNYPSPLPVPVTTSNTAKHLNDSVFDSVSTPSNWSATLSARGKQLLQQQQSADYCESYDLPVAARSRSVYSISSSSDSNTEEGDSPQDSDDSSMSSWESSDESLV